MFIEKIETKKGVTILTAEGNEYPVDEDCVYLYRLRKNCEIDDNTFVEFLEKSDLSRCKKYLYAQIAKYYKPEKGYRDKLYEKGFPKKAIAQALASVREHGYIDDHAFAERYYQKYKDLKGKRRILAELKTKGIKSEDLSFLSEEKNDPDAILALAQKFMRRREKTPEERLKLMRHLASKGFSYDEIVSAAGKIFAEE